MQMLWQSSNHFWDGIPHKNCLDRHPSEQMVRDFSYRKHVLLLSTMILWLPWFSIESIHMTVPSWLYVIFVEWDHCFTMCKVLFGKGYPLFWLLIIIVWWFGTFFIFPYIGNNYPNWLVFFRGVETTNQNGHVEVFLVFRQTHMTRVGHCPTTLAVWDTLLAGHLPQEQRGFHMPIFLADGNE